MSTRELAAAYVLGELDSPRREEFERRLEVDAELRAEVEAMRPLIGRLESLPAEAWPQEGAVEEPGPRPERRLGRRRWTLRPALAIAALATALLLGGALGVLLSGGDEGSEPPTPAIALRPLDAPAAAAATLRMPSAEVMEMDVRGLPRSAPGEYYELWLLGDSGQTVPVVSFRVGENGTASVRVPLPAEPAAFRHFDVSRQHVADGTEHSSDSVLRGPT